MFVTICLIAILPMVWATMNCFGMIVNYAHGVFHAGNHDEYDQRNESDDVGKTALMLTAIIRSENDASNPKVVKGLEFLEESVQSDGGIYSPGRQLECYETCLAMMCLAEANFDHRYDRILRNANSFVKTCQWEESKGWSPSDVSYGGLGAGKERQPDLWSTAVWLDAIESCNDNLNDPSVKNALSYISRCQNIDQSCVGGFHAQIVSDGSLHSNGITTYSGLKCLLDAGIERDDDRVNAAIKWIRKYYDIKNNPGLGRAGLYHYYYICAKTLNALGMDVIEDAAGIKHEWRNEICTELVNLQHTDGSWRNENGYLGEDDPHIATAHALLAVSYCRQKTRNIDEQTAVSYRKTTR
jgi:squalene-hopene/tetraprenyl-beta-curcumene cyclase